MLRLTPSYRRHKHPSEQEWASALKQNKPDIAVIYEDGFNYLSKMGLTRMREAAFVMSEAAKKQGCTVPHLRSDATDHKQKYRDHGRTRSSS